MQKIIDRVYQIFGLIFFLSFFLTIITGFLHLKINIGEHHFNVPAFTFSLTFISLFVIFTLKPSWNQKPQSVGGWKKVLVAIGILLVATGSSYFGIYLPLNSKLLVEVPGDFINKEKPLTVEMEKGKTYYIEIDSAYTLEGSEVKVTFAGQGWENSFSDTVGQKKSISDEADFGTRIINIPFTFPASGTYELFITSDDPGLIKDLRLLEKNPKPFINGNL